MGHHDDDTAARRLSLLNQHFRERPVTGPEGHSYVSSAPRSTPTTPGIPYNLHVVDQIDAALLEVATHARAVNPDAGPLPSRVEGAYAWYRENIKNAPEAERQRANTIVYRQQLEHAIAMGETRVVRPHRCPACHTYSLFWQAPIEEAMCTNGHCLTPQGTSRTWTLAQLAYEHVATQKSLRECAT
jgi:hypothetical protein